MQVASYAFMFPNEEGVPYRMLLPLLDILNHGNEQTANVQIMEAENGDIYAYALRDIRKGEEVCALQILSTAPVANACSNSGQRCSRIRVTSARASQLFPWWGPLMPPSTCCACKLPLLFCCKVMQYVCSRPAAQKVKVCWTLKQQSKPCTADPHVHDGHPAQRSVPVPLRLHPGVRPSSPGGAGPARWQPV